jgi:hypothetical protein
MARSGLLVTTFLRRARALNRLVLNFLAFQAGWFSCVLGAANGYPMAGAVAVLLVASLHLGLAYNPRKELVLILLAAVIGALFDTLLLQTGWLSYANGMLWAGTAPYWIVAMWLLFATTLNVSLRWLRGNYIAAALLGLIGGPMSYYGGAKLGALIFINMPAALAALAVGWAVVTPFLVWLSKRFDGMQPDDQVVQHA